jgi:hypothetical protein
LAQSLACLTNIQTNHDDAPAGDLILCDRLTALRRKASDTGRVLLACASGLDGGGRLGIGGTLPHSVPACMDGAPELTAPPWVQTPWVRWASTGGPAVGNRLPNDVLGADITTHIPNRGGRDSMVHIMAHLPISPGGIGIESGCTPGRPVTRPHSGPPPQSA